MHYNLDKIIHKYYPDAFKQIPIVEDITHSYYLTKRFHLIKWSVSSRYQGQFEIWDKKLDDNYFDWNLKTLLNKLKKIERKK